jgi:phage shock protein PspC (stress-responsive transcriptional regulator)
MKSTISINLAGMNFHIDEDAYVILKQYLDRIKKEVQHIEGHEEIYNDIEVRISELTRERLNQYKEVITLGDIEDIISIMGEPEDISGKGQPGSSYRAKTSYRRMYRNPDDRIIGGVCSGMATYWNMDATLIRVIFVILTLFGMAGAIIYLILWIVLPEANTIAQKIEMKGEEVNIHTIIDFFKEEFRNVKRGFKKR